MKSFQSRARAVRAESQRLMAEIRQARAAMSRHARKPAAKAAPAAPPAPSPAAATDIIPSRKIRAAATPVEVAVEQPRPAAKAKPKPVKPKAPSKPSKATKPEATAPAVEAPPQAVAKTPRSRKPRASVAAIIADGLAPVAALQQAVAAAIETPAKKRPDRSGDPVSKVPSLGPGMVWRLNQLGVRTLGDLAAADAADLRGKLGKLGRMVNVEQWIAHARAA
jgi:predicted flap endonuclease-1-like 5' DNA nuclease